MDSDINADINELHILAIFASIYLISNETPLHFAT